MKADDDARRAFEQRALRNVRALVEKVQDDDRSPARLQQAGILLLWIVIGFFTLVLAIHLTTPARKSEDLQEAIRKGNAAQASHERSTASYQSNPRRVFIGPTMDPRFAPYVRTFVKKVETYANANYPPEIRGINGRVRLIIAIRFDGNIESIEMNAPSGNAVLDLTAVRLVRLAEPYSSFPEEIRREADVVHIVRTFEFGRLGSTKAAFSE